MNGRWRWGTLLIGLAGAVAIGASTPPAALTREAWQVVAVAWLMAVWWVGEGAPLAVTALVPLVAFPLLGVLPMKAVAVGYADPLLFLILGGFVLGHAMEVVGLHERFTGALLRLPALRAGPRRVALALMIATAVLSSLVSNTATMMTMLPIVLATSRLTGGGAARASMTLGVAYAASIGGMATLVGTPTNAVLAGLAPRLVGEDIGFARWMLVGVPSVLILLPIAWWVVTAWALPLPVRFEQPVKPPEPSAWRPGERAVLLVGAIALTLWLTAEGLHVGPVQVQGWGRWVLGSATERDAGVALLAALLLFLAPVWRDGQRAPLLSWDGAERAIPWSVILLFGGGFALGDAVSSTGITAWIADSAGFVQHLPGPLRIALICTGVVALSEIASNMATAQLALPMVAELATQAGDAPLAWMVPATLAASCGFMLPVATAANAIASEAGGVRPRDMMRAGLVLNLAGILVVTAVGYLLVPWVFG